MNKTKKGFTLIELIVVLAILAVIMAIAVPTAFSSIDSARKAADRGSIDGFNSAVRMRASFIMAESSTATVDKTLGKAFVDSGINNNSNPQSTILVKWELPSANTCGMFVEVTTGGTALDPSSSDSLYTQLLKIADTADDTVTDGALAPIVQ